MGAKAPKVALPHACMVWVKKPVLLSAIFGFEDCDAWSRVVYVGFSNTLEVKNSRSSTRLAM